MKIIGMIKDLLKNNTSQKIEGTSIVDSNVYQAGRDIVIKQELQLPKDILEKLTKLADQYHHIPNTTLVENSDTEPVFIINNGDLYSKLLQNTLEELKSSINLGKLNHAQHIIDELLKTEGFEIIETSFKIQFYYFQGIIYLNKKEIDECTAILGKIGQIEKEHKSYYKLMNGLSLHTGNKEMFDKSLKGLKELGESESEIMIKKIQFELQDHNFEQVISQLTELDQIKEEYKNHEEALYFLGIAYLNLEQYSLAKKYTESSINILDLPYKRYISYLCDVVPIISRRGVLYLITDEEKELLKKKLEDLLALEDYFKEKSISTEEEYWGNALNINLFTDPTEVIQRINKMPEELQKRDMVQLMLAEAYTIIDESDAAVEIYKSIYATHKNYELLYKIVTKYIKEKEYTKAIDILDGVPYSDYDSSGYIIGLYFYSYEMLNDYKTAHKKLKELEKTFPNSPLLYESAANFFYKYKNDVLTYEYILKAKDMIKDTDDYSRIIVAQSAKNLGYYREAIEVLEPLKESTSKISQMYVDILIQSNEKENLNIAEKLIDKLIREGATDIVFTELKAEVSLRKDNQRSALDPLVKSFEMKPSIFSAYNIIAIKLSSNDPTNLEKYIDYLTNSQNPRGLIMAANGLSCINRIEAAKDIAYKSIFLLENQFDEDVYLQYLYFHFIQIQNKGVENEKFEFNDVVSDTVIEMTSKNGQKRYICIDTLVDLNKEEGLLALNCEHYTKQSSVATRILGKKLNEQLNIDGIDYTITNIIDKHVFAFRYCLNEYTIKCPDSKALYSVQVSAEDPITPLIPFLMEGKKSNDFVFEQYNHNGNPIGLPLAALVNGDYKNYPLAIQEVLSRKDQPFYAGQVSSLDSKSSKMVLTFSSIVLLKFLKCYEQVLEKKEDIYITKTTLKKVKDIFTYYCESERNVAGTMNINDEGMPVYFPNKEEYKEQTINFWREILLFLEELEVLPIDKDVQLYEELDLSKIIDEDLELEPIKAMYVNEGTLICDDLFIRKLAYTLNSEISTTNTLGLLEKLLPERELLDVVFRISSYNYLCCYNQEILSKLIVSLSSRPLIIGLGTDHDKLVSLLRNSLSHPHLFKEHIPVLRDVLYALKDSSLFTNVDYLLEEIIKCIKLAVYRYNISAKEILDYLLIPAKIDVNKEQFITSLYNKY